MTVTNGDAGPARLQETEAWRDLARGDQAAAKADVQAERGRGAERQDPPATAAEAWEALQGGGLRNPESRSVIASYLAPGPAPRFDTPAARAEAERDLEAGQ